MNQTSSSKIDWIPPQLDDRFVGLQVPRQRDDVVMDSTIGKYGKADAVFLIEFRRTACRPVDGAAQRNRPSDPVLQGNAHPEKEKDS